MSGYVTRTHADGTVTRLTQEEYRAEHVRQIEEAKVRFVGVEADHRALVDGASGLRRAFLAMHGPTLMGGHEYCTHCEAYDGGFMPWPCDNYELARDWAGEA